MGNAEHAMADLVDKDLEVELQDVFRVMQVCRDTALERLVGADLVDLDPGQRSSIHRHNQAETVLYILDGEAQLTVGDDEFPVTTGDRIRVGKGVFHGFRTEGRGVRFLSVQSPPILEKTTGSRDLEPRHQ